ncbi:1,4-alpha-glucan branching enzyme GlgB (fragment) [Paraburkholderia dioscoreae]|uniref:1,4-alpha-glucan branching enzyme GlgB n=1 Tax=Paraburkholderia dioscoreae TaxID=2604047 RepID=A0A5Q4YSU2_9BURK
MPGMVAGILRRTPDARYAELAAPALGVFVGTVHFSPGVAFATALNTPTVLFRVRQCRLDLFLGMGSSNHLRPPI